MKFIAAVLVTVSLPTAAFAHHAFSANYEANKSGDVEGIVEEVFWGNPHVHFYLRVAKADGSEELWDVEGSNLNGMARRGWSRSTINPGDEIRVSGNLGRNSKRRIWLDEVVRVDGRPLQ